MKHQLRYALYLIACLTLLTQLAACQKANADLTTTGTPSTEAARRIIVHALLLLNTKPNRLDNSTVGADGQTHQNVIETIPPDRKRIVDNGTEIIVAGGKVYLKDSATAPWQEVDIPASTYLGDMPSTEEALGTFVEGGEFVRSDALEGRAVGIFRYSTTSEASGVSLHNETELWVGQEDGLPYKMVVDGETLAVSVDPATGNNKASAQKALSTMMITFDPSLKIEAPLP